MRRLPLYQSRIYPVIRCTRGWTIDGTDCCVTFEVTRKVTRFLGRFGRIVKYRYHSNVDAVAKDISDAATRHKLDIRVRLELMRLQLSLMDRPII